MCVCVIMSMYNVCVDCVCVHMRISGTGLSPHHSPFHARQITRLDPGSVGATADASQLPSWKQHAPRPPSETPWHNNDPKKIHIRDGIALKLPDLIGKKPEAISSSNYFSWIRGPTIEGPTSKFSSSKLPCRPWPWRGSPHVHCRIRRNHVS